MTNNMYKFKFTPTGDYYHDLAMRESKNICTEHNSFGYVGLYQMGEMALIDTKYYIKPIKTKSQDWTGKWLGKHNINSLEEFKNNKIVQHIAIREYHKLLWGYLKDYHHYLGHTIGGIVLTKAGMIAASHLVGHGEVKKFIKSNGTSIKKDGFGCSLLEYLYLFSNYSIDYNIEQFIQQLNKINTIKIKSTDMKETITKVVVEVVKNQVVKDTCSSIVKNTILGVYNFFRTKLLHKRPKNTNKVNKSLDKVELVINEITNDSNIDCAKKLKDVIYDTKDNKKLSVDNAKKTIDIVHQGCKNIKDIKNKLKDIK